MRRAALETLGKLEAAGLEQHGCNCDNAQRLGRRRAQGGVADAWQARGGGVAGARAVDCREAGPWHNAFVREAAVRALKMLKAAGLLETEHVERLRVVGGASVMSS